MGSRPIEENDRTLLSEVERMQVSGSNESIDIIAANLIEVSSIANQYPKILITGGSRLLLKSLLLETGVEDHKLIEVDNDLNKLLQWKDSSFIGFERRLELLHELLRRNGISESHPTSLPIVEEYINSGLKASYYAEFLNESPLIETYTYLPIMRLGRGSRLPEDMSNNPKAFSYIPDYFSDEAAGFLFAITRVASTLHPEKERQYDFSPAVYQVAQTTLEMYTNTLKDVIKGRIQ